MGWAWQWATCKTRRNFSKDNFEADLVELRLCSYLTTSQSMNSLSVQPQDDMTT